MSVIDFKSKLHLGHCIHQEAMAHEPRTNHLRPSAGFSSPSRIPQMRQLAKKLAGAYAEMTEQKNCTWGD